MGRHIEELKKARHDKHAESEDYLHVPETAGEILLFTPIPVPLRYFIGVLYKRSLSPNMGFFTNG